MSQQRVLLAITASRKEFNSRKLASISRDRVSVSEKMAIVFSSPFIYFSGILFLIQLLTNEGGLFRINLLVNAEMAESKEFMSGKVLRVGVFHVSKHMNGCHIFN